jgi:hypothetical protein
MPDWIFKNKPTAYATLASPSGTSGTTLTLTTGHGTRLPAPGAGQISAVRIENELITYTGNSGDVLTGVTRGAGATNHVAGTEVKNVLVEEWANAVTALSTDTKAALVGTSGTPQATNKFVTDADARNSNARPPTSHSHIEGDTTGLVADLAARVLSTDSRLSDARTPTTHAISHKATGGDVLAGIAGGYAPLDSGLLVPVANLGTGTPTGLKFLRDDRVWAVPGGGGGGSLTIEEVDGTPSVASATKLILPSGTVSVTGTEATYTPAGGGGGMSNPMTGAGDTIIGSAAATTNVALQSGGVTATASSVRTPGSEDAIKAFDANDSTFWCSAVNGVGEWVYADLQSAQAIVSYRLKAEGGGNLPTSYRIQSSTDASTWTTRHTVTGNAATDSGEVALSSGSITARYWRFLCDAQVVASVVAIDSFELRTGTAAGVPVRLPAGQTLTDAATITWDVTSGHNAQVTLGGNRTLAAPTNLVAGQVYTLRVVQDGTGSRTLTWNAVFKWPSGTAPMLSTGAGKRDVFVFVTDGTNLYATAQAIDVR